MKQIGLRIIPDHCDWEGFAAFYMEDRHSFGNGYSRELVFDPGKGDDRTVVVQIGEDGTVTEIEPSDDRTKDFFEPKGGS